MNRPVQKEREGNKQRESEREREREGRLCYVPCTSMALWKSAIARGKTPWQHPPSGMALDLASLFSRCISGESPATGRYAVPRRPCDRSARPSRRGLHHAHSSTHTAHHAMAATAAAYSASRGRRKDPITLVAMLKLLQ